MKKILSLIAMTVVCMTLLCGCTNEDVYNSANAYLDKVEQGVGDLTDATKTTVDNIDLNAIGNSAKNAVNTATAKSTTAMGKGLNKACPVIIVTSLVIGIILWLIAEKASAIKLKQTAIGLFIVAIPFIMLLITYGMAFLSSWFSS